jgi:hypothetical protein
VLTQRGREAGRNLLDALDGERARHGERGAGAGIPPSGGSTSMTSAPRSARMVVATGPAM